MKAAVVYKLNTIPQYGDFPDPEPKENQQLIRVKAASIKNLDRMLLKGTHYSNRYKEFPAIAGVDGVGILENGIRVYAGATPPYGTMAEMAIIAGNYCVPVPDTVDDITAAAIPNPAVSAWLSLQWRGNIKKGDTIFISGATGVTGKLAIQLARQMGAGKIIATGRNEKVLQSLHQLGADHVISLMQSEKIIKKEIHSLMQQYPFDIVLDYLWGQPAETILEAITGDDLTREGHATRYIQVGEMAGSAIRLTAATLRSAGVELCGQGGGRVPGEIMARIFTETIPHIFHLAAEGKISMDTEIVPLQDIEKAWLQKDAAGRRLVAVP
ncbi:MAG: zinc-binding alcohol dehydrogenase family protein [Ginsengibacter sp.]